MHQRPGSVAGAQEIHDQVERLRVQDRRRLEVFSRRRRSREHKNSRANNRADAQRRQRPRPQRLTEPVLWMVRFRDQLIDRLATESLAVRSTNDGGWLSGWL